MKTYENGYMGKIEYWTYKLLDAVKSGDIREIDHVHHKLDYFIQRQFDLTISSK